MEHWGGGEEFLLKLSDNIKEYELIVATPPGESSNRYSQAGVKVIIIKSLKKFYRRNNKWNVSSKLKILINIKISSIRLLGVILKHKIDFILCNGNLAGLYGLPAAFLTMKRLLIVQHLIYDVDSVESGILRLLNRHSYKMICISDTVKENVNRILGKKTKDNLVTIYHGISLPKQAEKIDGKKGHEINAGVIGSIIRLKGISLIIESLKEVIQKNPDVHLNIFGEVRKDEPDSSKYYDELLNQIEQYGINNNVHFRGFEKSKEALYSNLDIVVSYSTVAESFSLIVLEALSFGKIVVAAELGGPAEIISNGYNGFLVPPQNIEKLRERLDYCIKNKDSIEFNTIKKNARNTIEEKYSLKRFTAKYKNLFDTI